jgi:hypothetical protein
MKIRVKVYGHQYFSVHEGEAIAWLQSVEHYADQGGKAMQVPCVLLRTDDEVLTLPLQTERRWTEIELM